MVNYFLNLLTSLRQSEVIILYKNEWSVSQNDENEAITFLEQEYNKEAYNFPHKAPDFDHKAALWAGKIVYYASLYLLYRENDDQEIAALIQDYPDEQTPSAILSADVVLRFIPDILSELQAIDTGDVLVSLLEKIIIKWHYSALHHDLPWSELSHDTMDTDKCLLQLYCNRIIKNKIITLARVSPYYKVIKSNMGDHTSQLWHELSRLENEH